VPEIIAYFRTLPLGRLLTTAFVLPLCAIALDLSYGTGALAPLFALLPRSLATAPLMVIIIFGPVVLLLLWFATLVLAVVNEGWRGLLLLATVAFALPAAYMHLFIWACMMEGACP
jgi:hypothetical protein